MIALYNSNRPGYTGILVDTDKKKVIADLKKLTDGWNLATHYKREHGLRCKTERLAEMFRGFEGGGYFNEETGIVEPARTNVANKYTICQRFEFMDALIDMVVAGVCPSAIITGPGGIGKTYSILRALERAGYKEGQYTVIKGFTTPLGLYRTLHDNRRALIIFDDCDSAFREPTSLNLLKGALDSTDKRWISWNSSKLADGYDTTFEFEGRILFVSNIPINGFDGPLISRSMIIDLQMSRDEIIDHVEKIAPKVKEAQEAEIKDVVQFLKDNKDAISDLNIRTYIKILKIRQFQKPEIWKQMSEFMCCS